MANAPQPRRSGVPAKGAPAPKQSAAKAQRPEDADAENAKTVLEKPVQNRPAGAGKPGKAAAPAPPVPDPENAQTVLAEPVVTDEDIVAEEAVDEELKLQTDESAEGAAEKKGKRFRPITRPDDLEGRPTRILETAHYLIFGGIVLVVIIIGGAIYMFQGNKALPEKHVTASSGSSGGTGTNPGPAESKTSGANVKNPSGSESGKTGDPSKSATPPKAAIDYTANPANKACFHGCMIFLMWARENALEWTGAQLTAKFKTEVPGGSVSDPEVTEISSKIQGLFNTGLVHPINTSERLTFGGGSGHGERQVDPDAALKKNNELMGEIRLLTVRLRKRYGDPPAPPEPPAKTTAPDEAKTGSQPGPAADGPDGKPLPVAPPMTIVPESAKTPTGPPR
ncbi:MAG: hypothetical protein HY291_11175 [Planctomycetes bacterium]|nr:hypothetical protein [Planctomycetota bacterium]